MFRKESSLEVSQGFISEGIRRLKVLKMAMVVVSMLSYLLSALAIVP
jgi:hypothetical protein